jgi:hypothetical protein
MSPSSSCKIYYLSEHRSTSTAFHGSSGFGSYAQGYEIFSFIIFPRILSDKNKNGPSFSDHGKKVCQATLSLDLHHTSLLITVESSVKTVSERSALFSFSVPNVEND